MSTFAKPSRLYYASSMTIKEIKQKEREKKDMRVFELYCALGSSYKAGAHPDIQMSHTAVLDIVNKLLKKHPEYAKKLVSK
jgi:hypothetical protein